MTDAQRREYLTTVTDGKDMKNPRNQQGFRGKVLREGNRKVELNDLPLVDIILFFPT